MKIDDTNYSYCKSADIGETFKKPLYKLITSIEIAQRYKNIVKIAFYWLIAAIVIIPVGMAWLIGKAICKLSNSHINYDMLCLAPPTIVLPDRSLNRNLAIKSLLLKYKALKIPNDRAVGQTTKEESLEHLCDWIDTKNDSIYYNEDNKRELFCSEMSLLLKAIVHKLNDRSTSKDQEREVLLELAEASTRCYPTWLEVATKMYKRLHGQEETVPVKLLRLVQEYKEELILNSIQNDLGHHHWHGLSAVRENQGFELGLNSNQLDAYAPDEENFDTNFIKWMFLHKYENVNRLIEAVQAMINLNKYDPTYFDHMTLILKQLRVSDTQSYIAKNFYTDDYKVTYEGVNFLLRSIGIVY